MPQYTNEKVIEAVRDFAGTGLSIMEVSHRSKEFVAVMDQTVALFKELLDIPSGYSVIFLGGGASLQFAMVPMNLLEKKAAYVNTGEWAGKALKEAKLFGEVVEVAAGLLLAADPQVESLLHARDVGLQRLGLAGGELDQRDDVGQHLVAGRAAHQRGVQALVRLPHVGGGQVMRRVGEPGGQLPDAGVGQPALWKGLAVENLQR